jgi:hypothetical protein
MPDKSATRRAKEDLREGKSPSTAAGVFVHEESNMCAKGNMARARRNRRLLSGLTNRYVPGFH